MLSFHDKVCNDFERESGAEGGQEGASLAGKGKLMLGKPIRKSSNLGDKSKSQGNTGTKTDRDHPGQS